MTKTSLLFIPLILLSFIIQAQVATISDDIYLRNDEQFQFIGKVENSFYVVKDVSNGAKVYSFNSALKLDWEKEIITEKKNYEVLGTIARPEYYGIILQYKKNGDNIVQFQKFDQNGDIIDSMVVKNYGQRLFSPRPTIVRCKNQTKFVIFNDKEDNVLEATSFDTEKMEVIWDDKAHTHHLSLRNELYQLVVDKQGTLYAILYNDYSKANREKNRFTIYQIGKDLLGSIEIPFQSNLLYDVYFDFDEINNNLVGAGLYDDKKFSRISGYFFLKMPKSNPSNAFIRFESFSTKTLTTIRGKESKLGDAFSEAYVKELVLKSDGGLMLVIERFKKISHVNTSPVPRTSRGRRSGYSSQAEYHYDDIIVVNMDGKGESEWERILYKRQFSRDDGGNMSSFKIMKTPKELRILYNDEIKSSDNKISEYTLSRTGEDNRNAVLDTDGYDVNLMFRNAIQTTKSEIVIPSIKRKDLRLVRIRFGQSEN